ncbi:uncharacterized protein LOC142983994 [Anticarsia gemmatalis]|uniref:uncharacterized protein LOC142983994 n=1 Tax=Anticarsia gemmatalis TaxID=129554 RepID=UPI003F775915
MDFNFEESLKVCLNAMRVIRTHPDREANLEHPISKSTPCKALFVLSSSSFIIFTVFIFRHNIIKVLEHDFIEACRCGVLTFSNMGGILNAFLMIYHRESFKLLLDMMRNDFNQAKTMPSDDQEILHKVVVKQRLVLKIVLYMGIISGGPFIGKSTFLMLYYYCIGEPQLLITFNLTYPGLIEERKHEVSMFLFLNISAIFYTFYIAVNYIAFLPLAPVLMLHACGQLELIKKRLDELHEGELSDVNVKLNEIAAKLQYIYKLLHTVPAAGPPGKPPAKPPCTRRHTKPPALPHKGTAGMAAGVCRRVTRLSSCLAFERHASFGMMLDGFVRLVPAARIAGGIAARHEPGGIAAGMCSTKRGEFSFEIMSFVMSSFQMSSIPSYFSDQLLNRGEEVSTALYTCGWERHYDKRERSTILLLLIRTSRPVALRTMFNTLCLDSLTGVFRRAYTIFSLMNAVF